MTEDCLDDEIRKGLEQMDGRHISEAKSALEECVKFSKDPQMSARIPWYFAKNAIEMGWTYYEIVEATHLLERQNDGRLTISFVAPQKPIDFDALGKYFAKDLPAAEIKENKIKLIEETIRVCKADGGSFISTTAMAELVDTVKEHGFTPAEMNIATSRMQVLSKGLFTVAFGPHKPL